MSLLLEPERARAIINRIKGLGRVKISTCRPSGSHKMDLACQERQVETETGATES